MARLFMVSVTHDDIIHWATIVNYPDSPSTFEVSFFKEFGLTDMPRIILEKVDGKLEVAKESAEINEEFLKAVVRVVESHVFEKSLNL